jgi:hypothetical protein
VHGQKPLEIAYWPGALALLAARLVKRSKESLAPTSRDVALVRSGRPDVEDRSGTVPDGKA